MRPSTLLNLFWNLIEAIKKNSRKIVEACSGSVINKRLAILGISFKDNTDDIWESTALYIISELESQGAVLRIYDPIVKDISLELNGNFGLDVYDTLKGADAVIIMTEWNEFRQLDLSKVKYFLRKTIINSTLIDLRNLYSPQEVIKAGIRYCSIGRKIQEPA